MTSRQIVERLIDEKILTGEEAFTLINDICKNEMYDVWKTLEGNKTSNCKIDPSGIYTPNTITSSSPAYTYSGVATTANDAIKYNKK